MNVNLKTAIALAIVAVMCITPFAGAQFSDAEDVTDTVGSAQTYDVPTGTSIKDFILDKIWSDGNIKSVHNDTDNRNYYQLVLTDLTLNLQEGGTYYLNRTLSNNQPEHVQSSVMNTFSGDRLTINGNGATIVVQNNAGISGGQATSDFTIALDPKQYCVNMTIDDVRFVPADGISSSAISLNYYRTLTLTGCSFENITLTSGAIDDADSRLSIIGCTFDGDNTPEGYFAMTLNEMDYLRVEGCTISDYDRGVNIKTRIPNAEVNVTGNTFTNLQGTSVIQFGESDAGDVLDANISGNTFQRCTGGILMHEVSNATGNIISTGNDYIDVLQHFIYDDEGESIPPLNLISEGDRFENDGRTSSQPVITTTTGGIVSDKVQVVDPVVDPEDQYPLPPIWDDDDYVPLPPTIVSDDSGSSDDTVKVVACAAAAVAAALIALILVTEYRKK